MVNNYEKLKIYMTSIGGASGTNTTSPSCLRSKVIEQANRDVFIYSSSHISCKPSTSCFGTGSNRWLKVEGIWTWQQKQVGPSPYVCSTHVGERLISTGAPPPWHGPSISTLCLFATSNNVCPINPGTLALLP